MGIAENQKKQSGIDNVHGRQERERERRVDEKIEEVSDPDRPQCPRCGWHNTRLSHTRNILDTVLRRFALRAFRCRSCGNRFRVVMRVPK